MPRNTTGLTAAEIATALGGARRGGDWRCICPLHGGHRITLADGGERLVVRCWAGYNRSPRQYLCHGKTHHTTQYAELASGRFDRRCD